MQRVEFRRPDGALVAGMGVLIILAATVGVIMVAVLARHFDPKTAVLLFLGFVGACALGAAFINAWRVPMLVVRSSSLTLPTFFGAREIPIRPGQPLGEFLASSIHGSNRVGTIESNKWVHFYTLDAAGRPFELMSMHRAAPELDPIRRAFQEVAGLKIETLKRDPKTRKSRPDVAHWTAGRSG